MPVLRFCLCDLTILPLGPLFLGTLYSPMNYLFSVFLILFFMSSLQDIQLWVSNLHGFHVCPKHISVHYMYSCVGF